MGVDGNMEMSKRDDSSTDNELDLLDILLALAKEKKKIILTTLATTVISVIASFLITPKFTATTKILPPQQSQSTASAILGQVAGIAGGSLGLKNPADLYVSMLGSRTIEDALIKRFDLKKYYDAKYYEQAREVLFGNTDVKSGKDGIISISFTDKDPQLAAEITNAYVNELDKLNGGLAITEASQRRIFYEKQLKQASEKLASAQTALKHAVDVEGINIPDVQSEALVGSMAQLRAQVSAKEIQIASMASYASDSNPDLVLAKQQLVALQDQLNKLEKGSPAEKSEEADKVDLQSAQRLQDVKYYKTLYELLAKQYELARLDEAKDPVIIQVVDKAVVPVRKSKPKRSLIVIMGCFAGFFLSVVWVLGKNALENMSSDPDRYAKYLELKKNIRR